MSNLEDATHKDTKQLGWTITKDSFGVCKSCAISKANQKIVKNPGTPKDKSTTVNGCVYLDLTHIVGPKSGKQPSQPNWFMIIDEKTGSKSTSFHELKYGMVLPTCAKLKNYKQREMSIQKSRIDNTGENKKLIETLNSKEWKIFTQQ